MQEKLREEIFLDIYKNLNDQQKKAVDTIEGPVMVIAGPGTGKTQILSARIGKILLHTDAKPDNILCLTFTDAGVVAMRKRLISFIGPDAYKVNICTFHSFCNQVIQDNLSLFEKPNLDPISDLERIHLFRELINSFHKNHPLKRFKGDIYFDQIFLRTLFSDIKKEGWAPEFLIQKVDEYLKELPLREEFQYKVKYKEFKSGDVNKNKLNVEVDKMNKLKAGINEFENFQQLMQNKKLYDFDDMINWVIKAFEENKNLLATYQEQYQYILVDEFQDTSGTQNRIVELLLNYWDAPNVFVVGDDDQSIYRFQGANVENMLSFSKKNESHLLTVVLTNNYRSNQPILNTAKYLIENNQERLINQIGGLSKELIAANENRIIQTNQPVITEYENPQQEMTDVVAQIELLLNKKISPEKIAVIYKENKYGETLGNYFLLKNIPFYNKRSANTFNEPLTQKIILILQYLDAEHDYPFSGDEQLFEILHLNWFQIPALEIAKVSIAVAKLKYTDKPTSIRQFIAEKSINNSVDLFNQHIHPNLIKASGIIEELISEVSNQTLQNLFQLVITKTNALKYIMEHKEKHKQLKVLTTLFDFVKNETQRNPELKLTQFVENIEIMKKEKISLPFVQINGTDKAVNLLTAHGSKGLEFEHVFFVGCNAHVWEKKKSKNSYRLPDTIISISKNENDFEELRRLFYVALTRAESYLNISYSTHKEDGKDAEPSMFIEEIKQHNNLEIKKANVSNETLSEFAILNFSKLHAPEISTFEDDLTTRILEKFTMNVTALNNYLDCPLKFYYSNLVQIPSAKNEYMVFGSAVHYAFEKLFKKMQDNNNEFPPLEIFIQDFEWYMNRNREGFTQVQFKNRMEYGPQILSAYYNKYIHSFNKIVSVEKTIRNIAVNGIPLKGKLDKLEFNSNEVNIVDYKTGKISNAKEKLKRPDEKNNLGGDYWRQAVFYKILIDNYDVKNWKAVSTEFDFVEPDDKGKYHKVKIVITDADITTVKQQIIEVWNKIQNKEFYIGCGKTDCHWCNFVKTNDLSINLHEVEPNENEIE